MGNLISEILATQGYHVLRAHDGPSALERAESHDGPLHLLVSDVVMPRMTGQELAHRLRASRPELQVILTSGFTDHPAVSAEELGGAFHFLPKPFSPEQLCTLVRASLDALRG